MSSDRLLRFIHRSVYLFPMIMFACALYIVNRELKIHGIQEILASLRATPVDMALTAVLLTLVNYLVLVGYDWLALRYTGHAEIPLTKIIPAALLSYAISNNTGHAWAAGGSVRYRFYAKCNVPGWDILKISLFLTVTYLLGALTLGLGGSLLLPAFLQESHRLLPIHWLSLTCGVVLSLYWGAVFAWRKPLLLKGYELHLPSPLLTLYQTLVSSLDVLLSSLVLWVLLLGKIKIGFEVFIIVFVVAQVLGVISQVPGGIGIFESAFLWLMSGVQTVDQHLVLISALLLYRAIYYFLPLLLAGSGLLVSELHGRRHSLVESGRFVQRIMSAIVPQLYSVLLLFSGAMLLVSGSIPANPRAMAWLREMVPLPVVELSHLTSSMVGFLLIFLARGLRLKIDAAWYGGVLLLGIGIMACLLKGFDWREALVLSGVLLFLLPSRHHFQRRSSLLQLSFSKYWMVMMVLIISGSIWLGFYSHRDVPYTHELWWQFSYAGDAPRFLRALLVMSMLAVAYLLLRLFSVARPQLIKPADKQELLEAASLLRVSNSTQGFLVLLGDKSLFWNEPRTAFIMFVATAKLWIAMGDPVGNPMAFENLLWQFREQADRYGFKIVFYQISDVLLPHYLDLGLSLFKLGEEARIKLADFSLQGKQRDSLRTAVNKFKRLGYRFEIICGDDVQLAMPALKQISDDWLAQKHTREKRYSLGFFAIEYLQCTDIAVIRDQIGEIKAFANLWKTDNRQEIAVDLMRYHQSSPNGIMDYLFAELMLWAKAEEYQWFSMGMAPLAGLARRPLAPFWHKAGSVIFDLGDEFYNFEGLYEYKAKFASEWRPRYLATQNGFLVPFILLAITRLIAGGWKGLLTK